MTPQVEAVAVFTYLPTDRVKRFPRTVRPYPAETLHSYLLRLAAADCCPQDEMIEWLRIPPRRTEKAVIDINRLAAATGCPPTTIIQAIPELANRHRRVPRTRLQTSPPGYLAQARPACNRCVARRLGTTDTVYHWVTATSRICAPHRRWLGHFSSFQPDLHQAPEILQAGRLHYKLIKRYGTASVEEAALQASGIVRRWCERGSYREHRDRRISALGEHGTIIDWENPAFEAACYHEVISLIEVLVSPDLIARGIAAKPGDPNHILAQVGRRIGYPDFAPYGAYDPFNRWLQHLTRSLLRKAATDHAQQIDHELQLVS